LSNELELTESAKEAAGQGLSKRAKADANRLPIGTDFSSRGKTNWAG